MELKMKLKKEKMRIVKTTNANRSTLTEVLISTIQVTEDKIQVIGLLMMIRM